MNQSVEAIGHSRCTRSSATCEGISFGDFVLFPIRRILYHRGAPLELGSRKLDILSALVERAGEVVSHRDLMSAAWRDLVVECGNLRVQINGLRKALGEGAAGARYIANVPGQGYTFVAPVVKTRTERRELMLQRHANCSSSMLSSDPIAVSRT